MKFAICFIAVLLVCTASAIPGYKPSDEDWYAGNQDYNADRYEEKLPNNGLVDEQELENMRARVYGLGGADQPAQRAFDEDEIRMSEVYGHVGTDQDQAMSQDRGCRTTISFNNCVEHCSKWRNKRCESKTCRCVLKKKIVCSAPHSFGYCEKSCAIQGKRCQTSTCSCV